MPPPSITPHIPQPPYIVLHLPPQICLDRHRRQLRRDGIYGPGGQGTDLGLREDGELGEDAGGLLVSYAVECLECFLRVCQCTRRE